MLLEPDKIYPTYRINKFLMTPSLEISEGVKVYTSLQGPKPSSIDEMNEDTGVVAGKINSFITVPRWIAITTNNADYVAHECGLVTDPLSSIIKKVIIIPHYILVDNDIVIFVNNEETPLEYK